MSGHRGRRRALLLTCLLAVAALLFPASAGAAKPIQFTETSTTLDCFAETDDGTMFVFANVSTEFGTFADTALWAPGADPENDPPIVASNLDEPASGSGSPTGMDLVLPLIDPETGEPAGAATLTATFEPAGDPEPIDTHDRFGNAHSRATGTFQPLAVVDGTYEIAGVEFGLVDCFAGTSTTTVFETSPNSFVNSGSFIDLECTFETEEMFLGLFVSGDEFGSFGDFILVPPPTFGFTEDAQISPEGIHATFELFDESGKPIGDTATVDGTFSPAGPAEDFVLRHQNGAVRVHRQEFAVDGTISVPSAGLELDMSSGCVATSEDFKEAFHTRSGPKPSTRLATNDVPEGALALAPDVRLITRTTGTSFEPEVEASCLPSDPEFGLQFGRTLWYRVTGTGGEVTIAPTGSNFDTAVVAYTGDLGALEEVGCIDDGEDLAGQFSRQGSLTIATDAGETYWVQVGGFAAEFGQLRLTIR